MKLELLIGADVMIMFLFVSALLSEANQAPNTDQANISKTIECTSKDPCYLFGGVFMCIYAQPFLFYLVVIICIATKQKIQSFNMIFEGILSYVFLDTFL